MILQDFAPGLALFSVVRCYRIVRFSFGVGVNIPHKAYPPKPEQVLHFFTRDPLIIKTSLEAKQPIAPIIFAGQQTTLVTKFPGYDFVDIQVVFQPTAVFQLTGIPAYELANRFFDGTEVFPAGIKITFDQLQEALNNEDIIKILDTFISELIKSSKPQIHSLNAASKIMVSNHGNTPVKWLANECCYSTKQFNRKFKESVGLNPKTYARVLRFNRVFNVKNRFPDKQWANIAAENGYTDYQHLAKDYMDFTGFTPIQFHVAEHASPENLLGLAKSLYHSRY